MSIEVRVPNLPESVADATLVAWHKQPGDAVARDENLVDLETDKVVLEVPAPATGVLTEVRMAQGATVTSGQILALIEAGASAAPKSETAQAKLSPAAKRVALEHNLDPSAVSGSGRDGRVSKTDVAHYLAEKAAAPAAAAKIAPTAVKGAPAAVKGAPAAAVQSAPAPAAAPPAAVARTARKDQRVPMTRLRARIAERMVQAQATQALLTSFNEVDLQAVNELRARYKADFEKRHGVKLGFMSFFAKACVEALKKFPVVNASMEGGDVVYHEYFDVGVAVSTDRGLIVPILRDVDQLDFADIEKSVAAYAARARSGSITIEELTGGTFTITNGGVFGSLLSTPIVNAPQSAILGMHKIQDRPVAVEGQIVIRPMMYVALTYDHRLIDGREAVQFLVTVKQCLEDPARLVLGV
ncbi:MAG TPA: 2-oxoglutarate dehydrogenase complex dihydrolipoyllysine-residue succinyltransferase [Steroidobacteraceae bacterium]|nr:2-oxoglutarate dehydrogenase complex dihydrolipoyllysine-residue succinyltransferase [Steroidobacteraceae bacterium]